MKQFSITLALIFFPYFFGNIRLHPVHITVTNIDFNKEQNFDISIKLFTDDFEKIIDKNYNTKLLLGSEKENKKANIYITKYIKSHLILKFNGGKVTSNSMVLTKRIHKEGNVTWLYFVLKTGFPPTKVNVKNSLMTDLYTGQTNLFIYTCNDFQEAIKFDNSKQTEIF